MPIYLDKANLIVSKEIIREKYQGGEEKFKADMNFGKRARDNEDDELFSIAAMDWEYLRL